jgi:hypothetical protein
MNDELAAILAWDREMLLKHWLALFGRAPVRHTHTSFMRLVLAWQHQAGNTGGAALGPPPKHSRSRRSALRPGTRLVRAWQGTTYHILVRDAGYEYAGKTYRSLSAIARCITGTAWSGPAFFGIE